MNTDLFGQVSILVLMEVLREVSRPYVTAFLIESVSILVLMEVLREALPRALRRHGRKGFNPCFNGSVERGRSRARARDGESGFQSLF